MKRRYALPECESSAGSSLKRDDGYVLRFGLRLRLPERAGRLAGGIWSRGFKWVRANGRCAAAALGVG